MRIHMVDHGSSLNTLDVRLLHGLGKHLFSYCHFEVCVMPVLMLSFKKFTTYSFFENAYKIRKIYEYSNIIKLYTPDS